MYKTNYESVKEFHIAFNYKMPNKPTPMSTEIVLNRTGFDGEETVELLHASSSDIDEFRLLFDEYIKRLEESFYKQSSKPFPSNESEKLIAQVDALLDKRYFNSGDFTIVAINPDPVFEIVHKHNMKKLFPDGKPRYDEHGKFIKPDGWEAPEPYLELEIMKQIKEAE